ncbi:uncharacterized protein LOC122629844 isoform X1 [Vespula pensylvanica]|uniref:Peroxidase n=1 Tax=Vespula pensylvanica TaxID=30213 RepID=A0A834P2C2_VESPE|nr:uncharacterized protein LOC122629844 isoform X1 [Vespula pensylvanica]XP_043669614.1 uncharacterized protein LOC122629844 isoform X1 [Vespula pensylvanica]KAF7425540.1 hypothetical protein H0235_007978 [Vespula pensylvanica]
MSDSEKIPLAYAADPQTYYVNDAYQFYSRRRRVEQQMQCLTFIVSLAIFTIALIVTISYSVSQSNQTGDETSNKTSSSTDSSGTDDVATLQLGLTTGFDSYTFFSTTSASHFVYGEDGNVDFSPTQNLTDTELKEALSAGQQAVQLRVSADTAALSSPLPSPSPESRHQWAVSTSVNVGGLALAAIGEIAATKRIESARSFSGKPSAIGCFFDGGWAPKGVCREFLNVNCTIGKYRNYDGSCNRPKQWGSALMPFRRILPADYADRIDSPRRARSGNELPSAREVSLKVHKPSPSSNPSFTVMLAVFGQFLDHDITATAISQGVNGSSISCCPPSIGHPECFPVPVGSGDPVYDITGKTCMEFVRSAPAPQCKIGPREQLNQVTAFIDGSAIYGSDSQTAHDLREFSGGRLRMQITPDNRTLLPASLNPNDGCNREDERLRGRYCFLAGDPRANENLHLTTMHLIWARQHNKIADGLAKVNPTWSDEKIYQEARRIIGAQLQHITYEEFVPIILGEQETNLRNLRPLTSGYREWSENPDDPTNDPTIANSFAAAAFRFAHTLLPGLMMMTDAQKGTSSYIELHRMLFNPYSLYSSDGISNSVISATRNVIQRTSIHVTSQLTRHLFEDPINNVSVPCGLDLVSLNIQRGRDHGLPGYTKWREYCNLGKPESFSDLIDHMDPEALDAISKLYESVYDIDLYTGALAEIPKTGGIVGPTFTCLIADQFVRLQKGDRYWYEIPDQSHSFTEEQLQELRKSSLARLLCDCSDEVTQIQLKVMRSIGADNPVISCEDIPQLSLEFWKEGRLKVPILKAAPFTVDWLNFKKTLNDTIQEIVTFINDTRTDLPPASPDWFAFGNELNNTFSEIRNQLNGLHPKKNPDVEMTSYNDENFILRAAPGTAMFNDWINFKIELIKTLNDTIGGFGGIPPITADWIGLKTKIKNQTSDLISQIISTKMDLFSNVPMKNKTAEMANAGKESIAAIFDWKNFKGNIINSLDDVITNIATNMPGPGDPAWATFGDDIKAHFNALRDKIIADTSTIPTELAAGSENSLTDWISIKSDILNTVSNTVQNIEDGMPPPGDPIAWLAYRDKIMKSFAMFNSKFPTKNKTFLKNPSPYTNVPFEGALADIPGKSKGNPMTLQLMNLTNDWFDFRNEINASIAQAIAYIKSKNLTTVDPVGWIIFGNTFKSKFAELKDEIAGIKAEWADFFSMGGNSTVNSPTLNFKETTKAGEASLLSVKAATFTKPKVWPPTIIPAADWITFKNDINDTIMNFLNTVNTTNAGWASISDTYTKSFDDLKNEIVALKGLITTNTTNSIAAADWSKFHTQLNTTVNDLIQNLKNQTQANIMEIIKILFDAKDKFSILEPPVLPLAIFETDNWASYFVDLNKTVDNALKNIGDLKRPAAIVKADEPASSSSNIIKVSSFTSCLSFVIVFSLFNLISSYTFRTKIERYE